MDLEPAVGARRTEADGIAAHRAATIRVQQNSRGSQRTMSTQRINHRCPYTSQQNLQLLNVAAVQG
jgi:hypothetical protein